MSSTADSQPKKSQKNKQGDPAVTPNDEAHNSFDSRGSIEDKEAKEAVQAKSTKKKTKKAAQGKEKEIANPEEIRASQEGQESGKLEEQKVTESEKTEEKKKKKAKKTGEKNKEIVSPSDPLAGAIAQDEGQIEIDQKQKEIDENKKEQDKPKKKKKEAKKAEGNEPALENVQQKDTATKPVQKKEGLVIERIEPGIPADQAKKPKNVKELEVKSPNVKTKEAAPPASQKVIHLTELKKTVQSPKSPPVIDLSAAKYAAAINPKQTTEKGKSQTQRPETSPALATETGTKATDRPLTSKGVEDKSNPATAKGSNVPTKDIKSPKNAAKTPSNKNQADDLLKRKPTATLDKQKTIQSEKSPTGKSQVNKSQFRSNTEGPEKNKPASATLRGAKSPQTYRQSENFGKNNDYFSPAPLDKNRASKNRVEKPRMRSFDAGKTDKITAEDPFDVRSKMWQIRKQEKLLEQEKKKLRKDTQECTFSPRLNQKSLSKQLSPYNIYERGLEWNEKIQSTVTDNREKMLEDATKQHVMKPRVKSGSFVASEPRKSQIPEGFTGPQFGVSRHMNVPAYSYEPLEYKTNLPDQITEIQDMYDAIGATIKAKALKNTARASEQPELSARVNTNTNEPRRLSSPQFKGSATKRPVLERQKEEVNRVDSLKGVLNLKSEEKKNQGKTQKRRNTGGEESDYFVSESSKPEEVLKNNPKQIEIRNNRYVMIDNNLSSIEKKDVDSNDDSLNFEGTETK